MPLCVQPQQIKKKKGKKKRLSHFPQLISWKFIFSCWIILLLAEYTMNLKLVSRGKELSGKKQTKTIALYFYEIFIACLTTMCTSMGQRNKTTLSVKCRHFGWALKISQKSWYLPLKYSLMCNLCLALY